MLQSAGKKRPWVWLLVVAILLLSLGTIALFAVLAAEIALEATRLLACVRTTIGLTVVAALNTRKKMGHTFRLV